MTKSYWTETANSMAVYEPLGVDATCDVAILGGGYTGLATAAHLLDAGANTVLLEAKQVGWGASGRNGGSLTPRYKRAFADIAEQFGNERALLLYRELLSGIDDIESNIARYDIRCDFSRCGQLTAAHSKAALDLLDRDLQWLQIVALDHTPRLVGKGETRDRLGVGAYVGGYLDMRGAGMHPLNYATGLAQGLSKRGLRIVENTKAEALRESEHGVLIETSAGSVIRARSVVLATDTYVDPNLEPNMRRRSFVVSSSVLVTEQLPERLLLAIVPGRHAVSDTLSLLHYFRVLPGGRLMFGGRGAISSREDQAHIYGTLERDMRRTLPLLGDVAVTHRWSGLVGMSEDGFPHAFRVGNARYCAYGYGGRGIVLSHILGRLLATMVLGRAESLHPLTGPMPRAIPLYAVKRRMMGLAVQMFALRDQWQAHRR
jgi:gamma-glutamylputrescine oxidase